MSALLGLLEIHILPQRHRRNRDNVDARRSNKHVPLRLAIRQIDRVPGRAAPLVTALHGDITIDRSEVRLRLRRQVDGQLSGEDAGPHCACDSGANGAADGDDHALHRQEGREVPLFGHGHEGCLFRDDEDAAAEGDENLAHDDVADVDVWLAELDHEADAEHGERGAPEEAVQLDAAGDVAEEEAVDDADKAGADGVDVADVGRVEDRLVEEDDVERVEVGIPDVPACVERGGHCVGKDDGAVGDQAPGDEGHGGEKSLPGAEGEDEEEAEDDEADDEWGGEARGLDGVDVEGEEEEGETRGENEETDDVEFLAEAEEGVGDAGGDEAELFGLALLEEEHGEEGGTGDGEDDGEDTETPAETDGAFDEAGGCEAVDPGGDEVGRGGHGDEETSVAELGGVGDEDSDGEVDAVIAHPVENLGSAVGCDVVAAGHHDDTHGARSDHQAHSLGTAPDVHDFGIRELEQTGDKG